MKVFRFDGQLPYGENILYIAADDIEKAKTFLPMHRTRFKYEGEQFQGLSWDGAEGVLEDFHWEE